MVPNSEDLTYLIKDILILKRVQHRATKILNMFWMTTFQLKVSSHHPSIIWYHVSNQVPQKPAFIISQQHHHQWLISLFPSLPYTTASKNIFGTTLPATLTVTATPPSTYFVRNNSSSFYILCPCCWCSSLPKTNYFIN